MSLLKKLKIPSVAAIAVVLYHLAAIFAADGFIGFDAFFHFTVAHKMLSDGIFSGISSLPLTILGTKGADHHFLFHVALIPFATNFTYGSMKLAAALFGAVPTLFILFLLYRWKVQNPWFYVLLLYAGAPVYLIRMNMLRVQSVSLLLIFLLIYLLSKEKPKSSFVAALIFSWTYHGGVITIPLAFLSASLKAITSRSIYLKTELFACGGYIIGMALHPSGRSVFEYLFFHLLFKTSNPLHLDVGREWIGISPSLFITGLALYHVVYIASFGRVLAAKQSATFSHETLITCALAAAFGVLTLSHERFIEYLIPFECVGAALMLRDCGISLGQSASRCYKAAFSTALAALIAFRSYEYVNMLKRSHTESRLSRISRYLAKHSAKGELIGNLYWDDYPFLYFHNQHNKYLTGLDPNYLVYSSPKLSSLIHSIRKRAYPPVIMREKMKKLFPSRYIVAKQKDRQYLHQLNTFKLIMSQDRWDLWIKKPPADRQNPSS